MWIQTCFVDQAKSILVAKTVRLWCLRTSELKVILGLPKVLLITNLSIKGGFFEEPDKAGTAGNRELEYDVQSGNFILFTKSYAKIECNMEFVDYPFDTQTCYFRINALQNASYQVTQEYDILTLSAIPNSLLLQKFIRTGDTSNIRKSANTYDWYIEPTLAQTWQHEHTGDNTSMIGLDVTLTRNPSPFYTNTYLPTILLTIISFIGFVIPVDMVPGRMALLVTIFLMLVNISSTERNRGPIVSAYTIKTNLEYFTALNYM